MNITQSDYILRRLAKVGHKKWEFFIISRIIHRLLNEAPDIEFVTQQLVKLSNGNRALTDLYFPQFNLHLEIDEAQHLSDKHKEADKKRTEDIVSVTSHSIDRIQVAYRNEKGEEIDYSLDKVVPEVDAFIEKILALRKQQKKDRIFKEWDFLNRYSPEKHINNGYIDADENVLFQYQRDALSCFGYKGGHFQRGAWRLPDSSDYIWFPRLYKHHEWDNELTHDGEKIIQRASDTSKNAKEKNQYYYENNTENKKIITFARVKNSLGYTLYRYVGTFKYSKESSSPNGICFKRISKREKTLKK